MKMNTFTLFSTSSGNSKDYHDQKSTDGKWKKSTEKKQGKSREIKSQPLINLDLGIGGSSISDDSEKDNTFVVSVEKKVVHNHDDHDHDSDYDDADQVVEKEGCRKCSVVRFTEEQVEELNRQMIIFKYIVWGLPVPFQLVLPIWRSFSPSSCVLHYRGSSPILLALSSKILKYQQTMDPDLGRCRRTDGKKWRCHQSVIPNEKYCQKHMHRGSKRSRKLVEASPYSESPNPIRCKFPTSVMVTTPGLTNSIPKGNKNDKEKKLEEKFDEVRPTSVMMRTPGLMNTIVKCNENYKSNDQGANEVVVKENVAVMKVASGLEFSPRSVLQNAIGYSRIQPWKSISKDELRCQKTYRFKGRCMNKVIPNWKYCTQHQPGSRKFQTGNPSSGPLARIEAQTSSASTSSAMVKAQTGSNLGVDTNLKISPPSRLADPRNFNKDSMAEGGGSTISSEATESDESTGVRDVITLSP